MIYFLSFGLNFYVMIKCKFENAKHIDEFLTSFIHIGGVFQEQTSLSQAA